jgi:hypothetical protein
MKILMSHLAMPNRYENLRRTVALQALFPGALRGVDRIIVTDQGENPGLDLPVLHTSGKKEDRIWLARLRNAGIRHAIENGYDWWIDGDTDKVLVTPMNLPPKSGYSAIPTYWSRERETHDEIVQKARMNVAAYGPSAFFLVRRDIFEKHQFCEEYSGYGVDDIDFHANVLAREKIYQTLTDMRGVHLWHPVYEKAGQDIDRNLLIYRRRQHELGLSDVHDFINKTLAVDLDHKLGRTG